MSRRDPFAPAQGASMAGTLDISLTLGVAVWITLVLSLVGAGLASRSTSLLDHPNQRSSHHRTTSRAGGVSIFAAFAVGIFVVAAFAALHDVTRSLIELAVLAGLAFVVGLIDDRMTAPPAFKFVGQAAVAALFISLFGPLSSAPAPVFGDVGLPPLIGAAIAALWIVGFMNAFNFMDGANGVAGGVAVLGFAAIAVVAALAGGGVSSITALIFCVAVFGFLPSNIFRKRLFMGDSGSQAISFALAGVSLLATSETGGAISPLFGPTIFLPFILDVTVTLVDRVRRKQNILQAHREHFYQRLLIAGWSHERVAVLYMTATAWCVAAAAVMLAMPAHLQWAAPAAATGVLIIAARRLDPSHRSPSADFGDLDTSEAADDEAARQAAQ